MNNIKQNLTILLAAVEAQPEEHFNLDYFKKEEPCGTLFCTAGLACTLPHFKNLGMSFVAENNYLGEFSHWVAAHNGVCVRDADEINDVFGAKAWRVLFTPSSDGEYDIALGYVGADERYDEEIDSWVYTPPNMSDKELAIRRLKMQIALYSDE